MEKKQGSDKEGYKEHSEDISPDYLLMSVHDLIFSGASDKIIINTLSEENYLKKDIKKAIKKNKKIIRKQKPEDSSEKIVANLSISLEHLLWYFFIFLIITSFIILLYSFFDMTSVLLQMFAVKFFILSGITYMIVNALDISGSVRSPFGSSASFVIVVMLFSGFSVFPSFLLAILFHLFLFSLMAVLAFGFSAQQSAMLGSFMFIISYGFNVLALNFIANIGISAY